MCERKRKRNVTFETEMDAVCARCGGDLVAVDGALRVDDDMFMALTFKIACDGCHDEHILSIAGNV